MPLLRDRFGDGYETVSETEGWSRGEYGKRSWAATVDKASRPCDSPSLVLESLPHLLFCEWARARALDSASEDSMSSAYGSELSTKMTATRISPDPRTIQAGVFPTVLWNIQPNAVLVERVFIRIKAFQITTVLRRPSKRIVHRGVLLMSKDDSFAGPTFSISFAALRALGFLFVACREGQSRRNTPWRGGVAGAHTFEFSLSAGQARLG